MRVFLRSIKSILRILHRYIYTLRVKSQAKSIGKELRVNHFSMVTRRTVLGRNVNFNGMKIMGGGNIYIGDYFHSGTGCTILTSIHNYDYGKTIPYDNTVIHKDVTIGNNVWFGINVTVLPGTTIGEGAIIQAGSVVCSDIPPCAIAGGHPARVFKYRDKDHYYKLKKANQFF